VSKKYPGEPAVDASDTSALEERTTLDLLATLVSEGRWEELASVPRRDIEALAQELSEAFSETEIASQLERYLKIPRGLTLARGAITETLMDLYDAAAGNTRSPPFVPLTFTDQCTPEGLVTGDVNVMPKGTKRVYAIFDNSGNMAGREYVLAMWRDPDRVDLVFSETERLRPHTRYNYVWLELEDGWPAGTFQLELYDPQIPSRMLAKQTFTLR